MIKKNTVGISKITMIKLDNNIIETEFYKIEFTEDLQSTHLSFKKKCESERYREAYTVLIKIFEERGHFSHITDTSSMGVISLEDQEWVKEKVVPQIRRFANSSKKLNIALILGDDVFANFAAKNIARHFIGELNIDIHYFAKYQEAYEWHVKEQNTII